jgi:hypothetical protein
VDHDELTTEARRRLADAEDRERAAKERAQEAGRELEAAPDAETRARREHEVGVHRRAAATHRAAIDLQREHVAHASRLADEQD